MGPETVWWRGAKGFGETFASRWVGLRLPHPSGYSLDLPELPRASQKFHGDFEERLSEEQNPQPPRSARERAQGQVPARDGVLGEVLGKVLILLVPRRDARAKHLSEHLPEHRVSGWHLPEHSLEHFWGVGGFALL